MKKVIQENPHFLYSLLNYWPIFYLGLLSLNFTLKKGIQLEDNKL